MKIEVIRENKTCPSEYRDFLVRIGGLNPSGGPNFRFVWGGSETNTIYGQMFGGSKGQHVRLKYHGTPAWHFEEWKPAEYFGDAESWYEKTYDYATGLHTMGDYPFRGDYICQIPCYTKKFEKGKLIIEAWPLSYELISFLVPAMWQARNITQMERRYFIEEQDRKEKEAGDKIIKDAYMDGTPAFGGVAGTYESNRERWANRQFPISAEEIKKRMGNTGHNQFQI